MSLHVVTGALGYSGRAIARRLLRDGERVRTLTNSPNRPDPFGGRMEIHPLSFDDPVRLAESLRGTAVLYNTYWVRFPQAGLTHDRAVENTRRLWEAARTAGVGRIVHVSITNPDETSALGYFRGKARVERDLGETGIPHAILRPALFFGEEDILINNIAWVLRRLPVFGVFGDGAYRLQPIHVDDFADLATREGRAEGCRRVDAIGPDTLSYRALVGAVAAAIGVRRPIVSVPPRLGFLAASALGRFLGDVVLTMDEIRGLMGGLLCTDSPPAGSTRLTEWARTQAGTLGRIYASELRRRRDRSAPYRAGSA